MTSPSVTANLTYASPSPRDGNGLFAHRNLKPGDAPLKIVPLVAVPDDAHLEECCAWCMRWTGRKKKDGVGEQTSGGGEGEGEGEEMTLSVCARCKVVRYCSKDCQKYDWPVHRLSCELYSHLRPRILPASVRAAVTIVRLFPSLPVAEQSALLALQGHEYEFWRSDRWNMIELMAKGAYEYSGTKVLSEEAVKGLYCRLLINSISHTTPEGEEIGLAFDPTAALMNHSCEPNAMMVFDGRGLGVFAIEDIEKGDEVTISYIDANDGYEKRRADLWERYWFECKCRRCIREKAELGK